MFRFIYFAICLGLYGYMGTHGYSSGAPPTICKNNLVPEHHVEPQSSPVPYSFSGANGVRAGDKIALTLGGSEFLGFAVQARDESGNPIGKFKIVESNKSQTLQCLGMDDTLTHKKISPDNPLTRVEFAWVAPKDYKGTVQFIGTVAKDGGTYWIRKVLKQLTVQ